MKSADIARNALGDEHIWTSEIYSQIALMYQEEGLSQLASLWIRKSFVSCYKAVGISHKGLQIVYTHLKNIEGNIDSPLANAPIEYVASKIKQLMQT